jgi:molybdate transport system substrate-binding protein
MTQMRTAFVAAGLLLVACTRPPANLMVSAAASLQNPLQDLAPLWASARFSPPVVFNFGGSGALAQQIEQGAPADIFFAAGEKPMDRVASLLLPNTRRNLLSNELVLIAPRQRPLVSAFRDLANPQILLVALGDPASVPAGDYGKQTLTALGLWTAVEPKLVLAKDVRQVLTYVETGNADAGLVYATDARDSAGVQVVEIAPPKTHDTILYPAAVVKTARDAAAARAFLDFLSSPQARAVFERHGFRTAPQ